MKIKYNTTDNLSKIELTGKFNIDFIDEFDEIFHTIIDAKPKVLAVNLNNVEYIDSSALGSLIKGLNTCKKSNIDFYLYDLKENIHLVFKLSYLDKFFNIVSSDDIKKLA